MVLKLCLVGNVRGRINAGEGPKVVNEMRLVEIATGQGDLRPIDAFRAARNVPQHLLKALYAAVKLGRQSNLPGEQLNEPPVAQTNLIGHAGNRAIRQASKNCRRRSAPQDGPKQRLAILANKTPSKTANLASGVLACSKRSRR